MLKLMKYELRKTAFSKLVLLVITAAAEIAFLIGVFWKKDNILAMGIIFLVMCTIFGVIYIGIESVNVLHRDLNTKQSYMLFLTPKSSYQILGAKILENGISIIMAGAFFAALAAIDVTVATLYIGGLKEMINLVSSFMEVNWSVTFTPAEAAFYFFGLLASWIVFIVNADLSVILSASVLAGKKGSGIAGFLIFLVISSVIGKLLDLNSGSEKYGTYFCPVYCSIICHCGSAVCNQRLDHGEEAKRIIKNTGSEKIYFKTGHYLLLVEE